MLFVALVFQSAITVLGPMLSSDVKVQACAVRFATTMSMGWPFLAIGQCLLGALDGFGKPVLSTVVNICCNLPLRVFLAFAIRQLFPDTNIACVTVSGVVSNLALAIAAALCIYLCTSVRPRQILLKILKPLLEKSYALRIFPNDL